jgi:hypothetical protein
MSTVLREFHNAQGGASVELAYDPRRGHGLAAMGPGQVQRSPSASQGRGGRGQGGRAPSCNARGRRAPAELAGHVKSRCRRQGWSPKLTNWPCTSICGLTT